MVAIIASIIGLLFGVIIGHVLALVLKHDAITDAIVKSGAVYKELVIRGDASMAMLHRAAKELESLGSGKRVIIAADLHKVKSILGIAGNGLIVKPDGS